MTTSHEGRSARVYQFPARGRFAAAGHRDEPKSTACLPLPRLVTAALGGNWYHEEAISEAERVRQS